MADSTGSVRDRTRADLNDDAPNSSKIRSDFGVSGDLIQEVEELEGKVSGEGRKRAREIIESYDYDTQLLYKIVCQKKGVLAKTGDKLSENKFGKFIVNAVNKRFSLPALASTGIGKVVRLTTDMAAPATGALAGGLAGATSGWLTGREKTESASRWLSDLDVYGELTEDQLKDSDLLEKIIGIIGNALKDKKVRGESSEKKLLANTYRQAKNALVALREEERPEKDTEGDLLERLQGKIAVENEITDLLAAQREVYQELLGSRERKVERIKSSAIGALAGVGAGYAFGLFWDKFGGEITEKASRAIGHIFSSLGKGFDNLLGVHPAEAAVPNQTNGGSLNDQMNALRKTHDIGLTRHAMIGVYQEEDLGSQADLRVTHHINPTEINKFNRMNGKVLSVDGFNIGDEQKFASVLSSSAQNRVHELYSLALKNNIDLNADTGDGIKLYNFLDQNKGVLARDQLKLHQILSFPSLANEIISQNDAPPAPSALMPGGLGHPVEVAHQELPGSRHLFAGIMGLVGASSAVGLVEQMHGKAAGDEQEGQGTAESNQSDGQTESLEPEKPEEKPVEAKSLVGQDLFGSIIKEGDGYFIEIEKGGINQRVEIDPTSYDNNAELFLPAGVRVNAQIESIKEGEDGRERAKVEFFHPFKRGNIEKRYIFQRRFSSNSELEKVINESHSRAYEIALFSPEKGFLELKKVDENGVLTCLNGKGETKFFKVEELFKNGVYWFKHNNKDEVLKWPTI